MNQLLLSSSINGKPIDFGALECGYTPVDLDTFAMDNGGTQKELVGRTYAGVDGYCPFAVYLGSLGYCLELTLRPGVQHSTSESEYKFERALPMAASLVLETFLVRANSGFSSLKLMQEITAQSSSLKRDIAFIIKWNPRRAPVEKIAVVNAPDAPMRHSAKRRRIKTVMQELMFKATRMLKHVSRWFLGLGKSDCDYAVFERHYGRLRSA